ncbi:hypothetical protein IAG41_15715 [Sphingomonas sp. JC676]|uniref:hypothetical protein n=1 Tax=Sphingomonas sp. JC676 TaxID=2768065 RepID=UPI0016582EEC|nr:hypothetical protein [Sphingomonas sp. JC676]MBC9033842.1 hypothetical protein [Sphingomonas sp. JC676]
MPADRIVSIGFLTQHDLDRLGSTFTSYIPVADDDLFTDLLDKLDQVDAVPIGDGVMLTAHRETWLRPFGAWERSTIPKLGARPDVRWRLLRSRQGFDAFARGTLGPAEKRAAAGAQLRWRDSRPGSTVRPFLRLRGSSSTSRKRALRRGNADACR